MTEDAGLYVAIAEIAGVFVGFGALISITGREEIRPPQLGQLRAVVTLGLVVVVAALVPVVLGAYDLDERVHWAVASLVFLGLVWAVILLSLRLPTNRELVVSQARTSPVLAGFFWIMLELPIQVPLVLAILGVFPDHGAALYLTALVFNLFEAAFVLALLVYSHAIGD